MGLTVQYNITTTCKSRDKVKLYLEQARQMAMDLAFEEVGELVEYDHPTDETVSKNDRWLFTQSQTSVEIPWTRSKNSGSSQRVYPEWFAGFSCWPGPGCESLEIVLAQHPRTIEVEYKPEDDARFLVKPKGEHFTFGYQFDWQKFNRWCERHNRTDLDVNHGKINQSGRSFSPLYNPARLYEIRTLKVSGSGKINGGGFCKTQYASECGMAHFVRCHLSVCHLLRRMESIPTFKVQINDEGKYETSRYSDDWREARKAGRNPTYVWHDATLDVKALIAECQQYNEIVAGFVGGLNDLLRATHPELSMDAPIENFSDFEHLEAKGRDQKYVNDFINALADAAKPEVEAKLAESEADT